MEKLGFLFDRKKETNNSDFHIILAIKQGI